MRTAQVWYGDFIVAVVIFIAAVGVFWAFQLRYQPEENIIGMLSAEALDLGNILNTPGYPHDWNEVNYTRVGITNGNNRIDEAKLTSLARMDYDAFRKNTDTFHHVYIQFEELDGTIIPFNASFVGIGRMPNATTNLVETKRLVIKQGKFVKMAIQVWN